MHSKHTHMKDALLADHVEAQCKQMDYVYNLRTILAVIGLSHNPVLISLNHHLKK
jgi:hypothetical protein